MTTALDRTCEKFSASPAVVLQAIRNEKLRRKAEESLAEFSRQAWHVIEPGTEYTDGWHLHAISEHLEAVTDGDIRNLLINMPPRHMKSILVAVMWPVWVWIARPEYRWLFASYAGSLSVRDSLKCRRLIESPWFKERWGHRFYLTGDQNAKTFFETDKYGYRFATSVGAATTGHGGDTLVVDDPHHAIEAQSDTLREATLEWWSQAMSTRLNNPKTGSKVIVMQRLHESDLSGHVLAQGGWDHLCLPAEYDGRKIVTSLGWVDPREKDGDLLWPNRFGPEEIATLKHELGEYGTAGQLQQIPAPKGGGILKTSHFQMWPAEKQFPALLYVLQSYDTALTEKTSGDPTACSVWGVFQNTNSRCVILIDYWGDYLGYPSLKARVMEDWKAKYGVDTRRIGSGRRADTILVEEKGSGISLLQDLRQANIPAISYNPGKADKVARAHQVSPLLEADVIYIPESKKKPGEFVTWAQPLIKQMARFPNDKNDDGVDTFTQAMIYLKNGDFLDTPFVEDDEPEDVDYAANKAKANPYAA